MLSTTLPLVGSITAAGSPGCGRQPLGDHADVVRGDPEGQRKVGRHGRRLGRVGVDQAVRLVRRVKCDPEKAALSRRHDPAADVEKGRSGAGDQVDRPQDAILIRDEQPVGDAREQRSPSWAPSGPSPRSPDRWQCLSESAPGSDPEAAAAAAGARPAQSAPIDAARLARDFLSTDSHSQANKALHRWTAPAPTRTRRCTRCRANKPDPA